MFQRGLVRSLVLAASFAVSAVYPVVSAHAEESEGVRVIAKINKYPNVGYSAVWGYTDPNGREYALLGVQNGTSIVDITDEKNIREIAFISGPNTGWRELKTFKHYAYVVTDGANSGVQIIDLSKLPASATLVETFKDYPQSHTIWVDEAKERMFLMGGSGEKVVAFSLADPLKPKQLSIFGTTYVHDAYMSGDRAYLAEIKSRSFSIWDISDINNPKFVARKRDNAAPSISFHNAWPFQDDKYLVTTEETSGRTVKIWDISDPQDMKLVSEFLPPNKLAHNVQIKGNYIYYSSYGGGIRIVDIQDPTKPVEVGYWVKGSGKETGFQSMWGCYPFFKSGKVIGSDIEGGLVIVEFEPGREEN